MKTVADLTCLTRRCFAVVAIAALTASALPAAAQETVKIGLIASLSGPSAKSGEAITRGLMLAIDEINQAGGLLGMPVELIRRDDENNPGKGLTAARELVQREGVAVLFGGLQTPVSLALVPYMNQSQVPFMGPWAAGTPITKNGADPNYIFRVSAVDEMVDIALVERAVAVHGAKNPGMMLINNPWGESNEKGLTAALEAKGMPTAGIERIEANDIDVVPQLTRLKEAGADTIFMVANVGPSAQVMKSLERMGWDVPVVSHWGPAGGRFSELAGPRAADVEMIQTFTFSGNDSPKAAATLDALMAMFPEITGPADVTPAVGIANAYDAMHLTALAITNAGSLDGPAIREGYYAIDTYEGLIKTYQTPFTPDDQDALGPEDYVFTRFIDGEIIPIE
ncbi:ethanolamine utilization protein EutN [Meridianimarinicoccus roseus]|uniref:Ethanolamine utilization protein EutN n=1 Tax=Meridianimarinicoccus roseus TaxID=2072018 RepID=A0A2V2LNM9_9RHOB|nr:ABC transporter substrate-binding protein [Meridianimarinicoccus roseus]PWR04607.1 ethanolamine utilization protein EutN [Meridianimarinicoccus roseus]